MNRRRYAVYSSRDSLFRRLSAAGLVENTVLGCPDVGKTRLSRAEIEVGGDDLG
jgi:hypothetical protein